MKLLITVIILTATLNVNADKSHYTVLDGIGLASCASYVKDIKNEFMLLRFDTWANGYISHFNHANKTINVAQNIDLTAREQWIYEYCKKNPLDPYEEAVSKLLEELARRQK